MRNIAIKDTLISRAQQTPITIPQICFYVISLKRLDANNENNVTIRPSRKQHIIDYKQREPLNYKIKVTRRLNSAQFFCFKKKKWLLVRW